MSSIFLHGGNDHLDYRRTTFGRFIDRAPGRVALIIAEPKPEDAQTHLSAYQAILKDSGATDLSPIFVTDNDPLTSAKLEAISPAGIFVCGGATPFYHSAICADLSWVGYLREHNLPYCGTSAGAAIAPQQAILGGWQHPAGNKLRDILFKGASEGLDPLTVKPGLGLVPFAVDVHASQWGTLTRLIHAVSSGLVSEGWAIDENTMVVVEDGRVSVSGRGQAYHVQSSQQGVNIQIHPATDA